MGNEITGYAIAIDGLVASIKAAEKKFDDLSATSEKTRTKIVAHFKEMGDNGVGYFIDKIEKARQALENLGSLKLDTNVSEQAKKAADDVNKLSQAMQMLGETKPSGSFSGMNIAELKEAIKGITKTLEDTEKALDKNTQQYLVNKRDALKQELKLQEESTRVKVEKAEKETQKRIDLNIREQSEFEKMTTAEQQSYLKMLDRMAQERMAYQQRMARIQESRLQQQLGTYSGAMGYSAQATTLAQEKQAIDYLNQAKEKLSKTDSDYAVKLNELNTAIRKHQENIKRAGLTDQEYADMVKKNAEQRRKAAIRETEAYERRKRVVMEKWYTSSIDRAMNFSKSTKAIQEQIKAIEYLKKVRESLSKAQLGDVAYSTKINQINAEIKRQSELVKELTGQHSRLNNYLKYFASRMALVFGVSQIKNYATRLVEIRGEFELENKSLQILLQNKVKANELWEKTVALAVESPFRVKELVSYTKQLAAYRIESDQLYDTTKRLADVSAGLGVDMQRLILAYGQVKAASFLRGCLGYGTKIRTLDGIKEVQDIKVGDKLINENNEIVNVKELIRGKEQMYIVHQSNGDDYRCNENHILTLYKNGDICDVYLKDIDSSFLGVRYHNGHLITYEISIEKDSVDDYYGFVLDGNKRFQLGDGTITHNTELRQFTEAGIPMLEELAKYFTEIEGKAVSVGDVFEMISKRMVKFSDVEEVFRRMTDAGGVFYNMQKEQAETLKGQISNLGDRIDLMMNDIGKSHDTLLKGSIAALGWVVENWKGFAWAIQLTVEAFAVYKVSALIAAANTKKLGVAAAATSGIFDKLKLSIQNIGKSIKALNLNPWVLGITAAATVAYELWSAWDDNQKMLENINAELDKMREKVSKITSDFNVAKVGGNLDEQRKKLQELVNVATGDYGFTIDFAVSDVNDDEVVAKFVELRNKIDTAISGAKNISEAFAKEDIKDELSDYSNVVKNFYDYVVSKRNDIINRLAEDESLMTESVKQAFDILSKPRDVNESEYKYYKRLHQAITLIEDDYSNLIKKRYELGRKNDSESKAQFDIVTKQIALYKSLLFTQDAQRNDIHKMFMSIKVESEDFKSALDDVYDKIGDISGLTKEEKETRIKIAVDTYGAEKGLSDFQKQVLYPFLNKKYNIEISVDTPKEGKLPEWVKRFNDYFAVNNAKFIKQIDEKQYNVTAQETLDRYKNLVKEREKEISEYLKGTPYMTGNKEFDLTRAKNELSAYKEAVAWFSRTEDKNNKTRKDTKDWWSELVKVIGDAHKEFVKLNEQLDKTDAMSLAVERFKGVYAEVAKNLKVSLKPLQDFNLETEDGIKAAFKYLRDKLPASAKNARVEIKKQLTDIEGEAKVKVETEANVELKQQIEDMFSGYELQLELDKMGLPPEMANLLFNVQPTNLESIRKAIDEKYAEATSQADIKNRDELLKKLSEMEDKQMQENFKKYSEYLIKAQNERVKLKLEELNKIAEVEKTFSMTATVAQKRFGVTAEQWRKYKASGDWSQSGLGEKQLADITAYTAQLNAAADRVRKSLQDETAKKMAKLDWEDFKGSEMYIEIFQNLENASTKSINAILERLQTLKGSFSDLSATEVKDIVSAMTKAEEELENRRPTFKALFSDLKQYIELSKTRNEDEKLYADLQKQSVQNTAELSIARNNLASAMARYRKLAADPNADKGELENAKANVVLLQKQSDGLENNQKRINKKLDETNKKLTLWQKLQKNIGDKLKDVGSGLEGISTLARTIGERFGDLSVEAEKAVQSVSDLGGVVSSIGDVVANPKSFSSWVGLATTAATMFVNLFNNDAEWQKRIEEQERLVNRLQRAYENLTETIESAYNIYDAQQANTKARYNLESQINARRAQINAEMQKKKKDKDQIIEWENEIKDLQEQITELSSKQREEMGAFGSEANYKSAAQQFVDAWLDAYKQTGSGLDALQDTFNDFYENVVKQQLLYRGTQKILEPLLKLFDNAVADYTVTEDEANDLKDFFAKNVKGQLDELYTSLADIFGIGKNVELSDLQKGIQNITEAQAAAIESYLNSIRFYVSAQLETIKAIQSSIKAPDYSPIVNELKAQTAILRDIYDTLSSVVGRGGSVHSGAYVKVYM